MAETDKNKQIARPPVIAVMGHIDHGKSKLLDYIRQTNVVERESGGITQHVSAYEVVHKDQKITFLDTPGHAAFEAMRVRGAQICDIAVLIVSAEEGVKTQTLEALKSIKEHNKPFVVAISKIDKPEANPDRTKQSLAENDVFVEGYGGAIPCALVSSTEGTGVDELLDLLLLVAEMEELKGNPEKPAKGFILETNLDPRAGVTATLIIKDGTLSDKDFVLAGNALGKIKKMENFLGKPVKELMFSSPVKVFGFSELPPVGCEFRAFAAKDEADKWLAENPFTIAPCGKIFNPHVAENAIRIPLVIKADVAGTLEAVEKELAKINLERVFLEVVAKNVGPVSENDVKLVSAFPEAVILGFKVKTEKSAITLAEKSGVTIKTSDIIYKLSEWLEELALGRTPKVTTEETIGRAKILKTFAATKDKQIIGGVVSAGKIVKGLKVKIHRHDNEIGQGKILDLQIQKIKVNEVEENTQFGAEVEAKIEIAGGDVIYAFETVTK
ncbi:MAG TPA: translation initiation factor IF-2 [Candidatus Paceibacterota bacterium]|nr:translation initiation factor IF-2 [Candidatus Paceibacterota bacterium]